MSSRKLPYLKFLLVCTVILTLPLTACSSEDAIVDPSEKVRHVSADDHHLQASQSTITRLARGIALALSDSDLRLKLLEDMRDSPFPGHSLHLNSYLLGDSGTPLANAVREALGMDSREKLFDGLPALELFMPIPYQRTWWTGNEAPVVVGILADRRHRRETISAPGWTVEGGEITVPFYRAVRDPVVLVVPVEHRFGPDPEARRRRAPKQDRTTVSPKGFVPTHDPSTTDLSANNDKAEFRLARAGLFSSLREAAIHFVSVFPPARTVRIFRPASSSSYGYAPGGPLLTSNVTWADCTADGTFSDDCLDQLAFAFRPVLQLDASEDAASRESYWAGRDAYHTDAVSIFYAPAYHDDGGSLWSGSHLGDSEFIWLTIEFVDGTWQLISATLSAHWGTINDNTKNYLYSDLEYEDNYRGRPISYVSKNKHANFHSESDCENFFKDEHCSGYFEDREHVEVLLHRYLGHHVDQLPPVVEVDCVSSEDADGIDSRNHTLPGTECFWSGDSFDGWHSGSDQTLGYHESLQYWDDWLYAFGVEAGSGGSCTDDPRALQC